MTFYSCQSPALFISPMLFLSLNCGLYYCFPLSVPTGTPILSDFVLPYPFRNTLTFYTSPFWARFGTGMHLLTKLKFGRVISFIKHSNTQRKLAHIPMHFLFSCGPSTCHKLKLLYTTFQ